MNWPIGADAAIVRFAVTEGGAWCGRCAGCRPGFVTMEQFAYNTSKIDKRLRQIGNIAIR
jgi:hypothetical protein